MFKSAGITFVSKLVVAIINFGIIILLSQLLGTQGKGQCSLYLVIFSTALIACECISGATVVYLLSKFSYRKILTVFYIWSIPASCVVGFLFYILSKINASELLYIVVICWLNAVVSIHQMIVLGKQRMDLFNLLNIVQAVFSILSIWICFKYIDASTLHYLQALLIAWGATFLIGLLLVFRFKDDKPDTSWSLVIKEGFKSGIANQAGTLMHLAYTRTGYILLPATELGIFSNAVSLCEASLLVSSSISTVQYSKIVNEKDKVAQTKLTHQCFWTSALLMFIALVVLCLLPDGLYTWLFGPQFNEVAIPVRMLAPGIFLFSCYITFSYFFSGTGRFHINNYPALAAMLFTLISYGGAAIIGIPISIPLVAVILVFSYATMFIMSFMLFLSIEKMTLKTWMHLPSRKSLKEWL